MVQSSWYQKLGTKSFQVLFLLTLHDLVLALKIHQELRLHPRHPIDFDQNSDWIPWKFQMNAWMIFDCSKVSWYWNYLENKWSSVIWRFSWWLRVGNMNREMFLEKRRKNIKGKTWKYNENNIWANLLTFFILEQDRRINKWGWKN